MHSSPAILALAVAERERRRRAAARVRAPLPTFRNAIASAQTITAPAWMLSGPSETGKTWGGLWRLDTEARRWANSSWVIVRKVRNSMDSTVLKTWRRVVELRGEVDPFGGERPIFYRYPNGAKVWVIGMDNPDKILSGEFDGIYANQAEELTESDWETMTTRVTGRGAVTTTPMVWGDCNPGPEDHWIVRRAQSGTLVRLDTTHRDNPSLYDEAGAITEQGVRTMDVLDRLTGIRRQRLRDGLWVGAEGQFFEMLDPALHLAPAPPRETWRHWWGALDWGYNHPLAFGLLAMTEDGAVHLVARHSARKQSVARHCDDMDALLADYGIAPRTLRIVAGHDCWATRNDDPETIADKFAARGYHLERAIIARRAGAQALLDRLGGEGAAPMLRIDPRARAVFDTLTRMVHDPRDAEDVLKVDADASGRGGDDDYDMLRYGVMAAPTRAMLPQRPRERVANRFGGY